MSEKISDNRLKATDFVFDEEGPIFKELSIATIAKFKNKTPMIIHRGGHVSVVLKFKGVDCSSFTPERFDAFLRSWGDTMNICNEDLSISVTTINRAATKKNLVPKHPLLKARVDYFNSMNLKQSDFYLTLFYKNRKTKAVATSFSLKSLLSGFSKVKKSLAESDFEGLNNRAEEIENKLIELGSLLASLQVRYDLIDSEAEYTNLFSELYGVRRSKNEEPAPTSPTNTFRKNLLEGCTVEQFPTHFELNGDAYLHFVMDKMPERVYGGDVTSFLNMPYEYIYTVSANKYDLDETKDKLVKSVKKLSGEVDDDSSDGPDRDLIKDEQLRVSQDALMEWSKNPTPVSDVSLSLFVKIPRLELLDEMAKTKTTKERIIVKKELDILNNYLSRFGGSRWKTEGISSWFVFNKALPGLCDATAIERKKYLRRQMEVPYLLGLWSTGDTENHNGYNHFIDDFGGIFQFNPFNGKENYNIVIGGGSGSGKSVLMDTVLAQAQGGSVGGTPPKVRVIDNSGENGSYYVFAKLFGGEVINFSGPTRHIIPLLDVEPTMCIPTSKKQAELVQYLKDNGVDSKEQIPGLITTFYMWIIGEGLIHMTNNKFNMKFKEVFGINVPDDAREKFTLKNGEFKPFQRTLSFIVAILDTIFASSGKKYQTSAIESFVTELFERIEDRMPTMTDLYNYLNDQLDSDDEDNKSLLMTVKNWTASGAFPYFEGKLSVNLKADFIVADLKGIESEPTLAAVYMLLFNELFSRDMYFTKGTAKYMVRDELWKLIRSGSVAIQYMEEDVKTSRKNGISSCFIMQSIPELMVSNPALMQALLDNSEFIFVGSVPSSPTKEGIRTILEVPDHIMNQAFQEESTGRDLTLGKNEHKDHRGKVTGIYSRYILKYKNKFKILRNYLSPYEASAYSSSPADYITRLHYMDSLRQFDTVEEYVEFIANKGHLGDEGLARKLWTNQLTNEARKILPNIGEIMSRE